MINSRKVVRRHDRGFSLIELMVAMLLGILVSIGLVSLFGTTSNANKVQNALAMLQENGRFAVTRMNVDLRMGAAPYCSGSSGPATLTSSNGALDQAIATSIYFNGLTFPDAVTATASAAPTGWPAGQLPYPLSPSVDIQGYECDAGGTTCSPALPASLPAQAVAAGKRVPGSDVLTLRYLHGTGWPLTATPVAGPGTCAITATRAATDTPFNPALAAGDQLFVGVCNNPVAATTSALTVAGNTLTATLSGLTGTTQAGCSTWPVQVTHVYDYSRDFITVTYYLVYVADPNPDATAGRLIPTLVRRVNGVDSQIVQGVDRLDFLYGVSDNAGNVTYLTADQVNNNNGGAITCPTPPAQFVNGGYSDQTRCLWRAVKSVEVHMLLDTVNDLYAVGTNDTPFCYSIDPATSLATVDCSNSTNYAVPASTDFNGMPGRMMRREFVSLIGVRNAVL
ncbi:MAG: PilW family protein [Rudaea sp.]